MWRGGSVEEWECGVPRRGVEELHAYLPSWWRSVDVESLVDGLFRFVDDVITPRGAGSDCPFADQG